MTSNQIAYWQLQEQKRSNLAKEADTDFQNEENRRHNIRTERTALNVATETARHNKADESIKRFGELEKRRANMQNEAIKWSEAFETQRSNRAKEYETNRSNVAKETETYRSNIAKETETNRHNIADENVKLAKVQSKDAIQRRANEIAYYNYQLNAKKFDEDVRWHDMQNTNTITRNANDYEIATQKQNLAESEFRLDKQQAQHKRVMDWANLGINAFDLGRKSVGTALDTVNSLGLISLF